jgi:hypothetical protein
MICHRFTGADNMIPLSEERAARRARIAAMMQATAKAGEDDLPPDEQRQCIDLTAADLDVAQSLVLERLAQIRAQRRLRPAVVLIVGLPIGIAGAYLLAQLLGRLADAVGAALG